MSEGLGRQATEEGREERFGHILLQTERGRVYSLNLYETRETPTSGRPGIAGRGFYLPMPLSLAPFDDAAAADAYEGRRALQSVLPEVELTADSEAFHKVRNMFEDAEGPSDGFFTIPVPERDVVYRVQPVVTPPVHYPERTLWSGTVLGQEISEEYTFRQDLTFVLEQYGTFPIELLLVLFVIMWLRIETKIEVADCYYQALRLCGEGNIKVCEVKAGIRGKELGTDTSCHIECFELQKPASEEEGER